MKHRNGVKKGKKVDMENVGVHFETAEEVLNKNISKINNFVPYETHTGCKIIDETKLSKKTEKPKKKGRIKDDNR